MARGGQIDAANWRIFRGIGGIDSTSCHKLLGLLLLVKFFDRVGYQIGLSALCMRLRGLVAVLVEVVLFHTEAHTTKVIHFEFTEAFVCINLTVTL